MLRKYMKLTLMGTLLVLASCGFENGDSKNKIVINSGAFNTLEEADYIINEIIAPFEEESGIDIEFQTGIEADLYSEIKDEKEGTTDLVIIHSGDMKKWIEEELVSDLTTEIDSFQGRTFIKSFDNEIKKSGKTYFTPITTDTYLTIANKKALKYLPETIDLEKLTWEDYANWSNKIREGEGVGKTVVSGAKKKSFLYQFGGVALSYGANFPNIDSDGAKKAWKLYEQMAKDFIPEIKEVVKPVDSLKEEKAWLSVIHNAQAGQIYRENKEDYIIAPVPKGSKGRGTIVGAYGIGRVKGSKKIELTKKLMEYLTRPEVLLKISKGTGGFIPPVEEANSLLGEDPEDEVIRKAMTTLEDGVVSGTNAANFKNWREVKEVYDKIFYKILDGEKIEDSQLEEAQEKLNDLKK